MCKSVCISETDLWHFTIYRKEYFSTMEIMTFTKSMNIFAELTSSDILVCVIVGIIALVVGLIIAFPVGVAYRRRVAEAEIGSAEEEARRIVNESIKTAESRKKEALVEAKDEIHRLRTEADKEIICATMGSSSIITVLITRFTSFCVLYRISA